MENQSQDETPHYDFIAFRREVFALDAADRIAFVKSEIKRFRIEARFYGGLVRMDDGITIRHGHGHTQPKDHPRNVEDYYLNLTDLLDILEDGIKPLHEQPAAELQPDSEPIRMKQATAVRIALALQASGEMLHTWTQAEVAKLFVQNFRNTKNRPLKTFLSAIKNQNSKIDLTGAEQITYDKVKEHLTKILASNKPPLKGNEMVTKRK